MNQISPNPDQDSVEPNNNYSEVTFDFPSESPSSQIFKPEHSYVLLKIR